MAKNKINNFQQYIKEMGRICKALFVGILLLLMYGCNESVDKIPSWRWRDRKTLSMIVSFYRGSECKVIYSKFDSQWTYDGATKRYEYSFDYPYVHMELIEGESMHIFNKNGDMVYRVPLKYEGKVFKSSSGDRRWMLRLTAVETGQVTILEAE